jgi:glutamate racemase
MDDPNQMTAAGPADIRRATAGKKALSIVILDSGMGGLSICARLVNGLQRQPIAERVTITYFNAWPDANRGYNRLPDTDERIRVFDRALIGSQAFAPDIVCIACNTLSILYPQTEFSRRASMPVIDIVGFGVDLIYEHLSRQPESQAIILGTLTTVASQAHQRALIARGIEPVRLVAQACDQLATEIEKGPRSPRVGLMIEGFIREASIRLARSAAPVFAALCCTHYGYAEAAFRRSLDAHIGRTSVILNPNNLMGDHLLEGFASRPQQAGELELKVVSRIVWSEEKVAAIADALQNLSPVTAQALRHYRHDPQLFTF